MSRNKKKMLEISVPSPILPGSISTAESKCGKKNCACRGNPPKLHGPYYRWTGLINGKQTTKTISKEIAEECEKRIANFRLLQQKVKKVMIDAIENAPWKNGKKT